MQIQILRLQFNNINAVMQYNASNVMLLSYPHPKILEDFIISHASKIHHPFTTYTEKISVRW